MRSLIGVLVFIICLFAGPNAMAQVQTRLALDASVGLSRSIGSGVTHPGGLAADASVALRISASPGHSPVLALSTGRLGPHGDEALTCTPDGCPTRAGRFRTVAALAGWELLHGTGASVRALLGPAWLRNRAAHEARSRAVQVRVDLSTPAVGFLALVMSVQGARYRTPGGSIEGLWSATAGVRLR